MASSKQALVCGCHQWVHSKPWLMYSPQPRQWAAGRDEIVEVNQRALIDKVLARYSGEFTGQSRFLQSLLSGSSEHCLYQIQCFESFCRTRMMLGHVRSRFGLKPKCTCPERKASNFQSDKHEQGSPRSENCRGMWFLRICPIRVILIILTYSHRSTDGRSRITACYSETRIGIDSRRLVLRHSQLPLSLSHVSLAEGNPDEEKIGAFGVGG
jgi:hypothetical protein